MNTVRTNKKATLITTVASVAVLGTAGILFINPGLTAEFTDTNNSTFGNINTTPINNTNDPSNSNSGPGALTGGRQDGLCTIKFTPPEEYSRYVLTREGKGTVKEANPTPHTEQTFTEAPGDATQKYFIQYFKGNWAGPIKEITCEPNKISATIGSKIEISKDGKTTGSIDAGDTIKVTYTVVNDGNTTLNPGQIKDDYFKDKGVTLPTTPVLKPGEKVELVFEYVIKPDDTLSPIYTQPTITLPSKTCLATGTCNVTSTGPNVPSTSPVVAVKNSAEVSLTSKIVTDKGTIGNLDVGDVVTYSWRVTNTGNEPLKNITIDSPELKNRSVSITPAPVTLLNPGEVAAFSATYTIQQRDLSKDGTFVINATASETPTVCSVKVSCSVMTQSVTDSLKITPFPSPLVDDFNYSGILSTIPKTLLSWENVVGSLSANGSSVPNGSTEQISTIDTPGSDFDQSIAINSDGTGGVALVGRMSDKNNYVRTRVYKNNYYYDPPGYWTRKWVDTYTKNVYSEWSAPYAPNSPLSQGYCGPSTTGYVAYYDKDYKSTSESNAWYKHTHIYEYTASPYYYGGGGCIGIPDDDDGTPAPNPNHFRIEIQSRSITTETVQGHYENDKWIDPPPVTDYDYHVVTEKVINGAVSQISDYRYGATPINKLRFKSQGNSLQVL